MNFAELIESAMYLYRATGDPTLLELGRDAVESIEFLRKMEIVCLHRDLGYANGNIWQNSGNLHLRSVRFTVYKLCIH